MHHGCEWAFKKMLKISQKVAQKLLGKAKSCSKVAPKTESCPKDALNSSKLRMITQFKLHIFLKSCLLGQCLSLQSLLQSWNMFRHWPPF